MRLKRLIIRIIKKAASCFGIQITRKETYVSLLQNSNYNGNNITIIRGGNLNKDKVVCIISFPELWIASAGFCAIFNRLLNGLYFCNRLNFIPVIKNWDNCPYFDGKVNGTNNVFEYYFYPPSEITMTEAEQSYFLVYATNPNMDIALFENECEWYLPSDDYISEMGNTFKKYISLNNFVNSKMKSEIDFLINDKKTLGVHFRGTDFSHNANGHPISLTYEDYRKVIDVALKKHDFNQIFLATDDDAFGSKIVREYQNVVLFNDVTRTTGKVGVHHLSVKGEKYRLGYEVIRDIWTLAKCDGLISGPSQVPILARIVKSSRGEQYEPFVFINKGINRNNKDWIAVYKEVV